MDNLNPSEVAKKIMGEIKKKYSEMTTLNIMVLGKTGVGKSTLINNMFNEKLADVGVGKSVTNRIEKKSKTGFPLAIFDTPGLELGGENAVENLLKEIRGEIEKGVDSGDVAQALHCIWYCVSTPTHRFEQSEIDFLNKFLGDTAQYKLPVIIVLTQSYAKADAQELIDQIKKEHLPVAGIVPVLAENYAIDDEYTAKAYGLDTLSEMVNNVIPEAVRNTFVAIQKTSLELKTRRARAVVGASTATAAVIGAVPIPFADASVLVPEQVGMLASITVAFGIPVEKATLTAVIAATIGTSGMTVLGRTVVSNLLKLIPGAGSVAGGAISATTAAALTAALGEAYIVILSKICSGQMSMSDLNTKKGKKMLTEEFVAQLKIKRDKKGNSSIP